MSWSIVFVLFLRRDLHKNEHNFIQERMDLLHVVPWSQLAASKCLNGSATRSVEDEL
eukprot:m.133829 g.133829  ORF g.133829 m.133829 type:complete len:57 (+) comp14680_c0_seq6:2090-2260(+)